MTSTNKNDAAQQEDSTYAAVASRFNVSIQRGTLAHCVDDVGEQLLLRVNQQYKGEIIANEGRMERGHMFIAERHSELCKEELLRLIDPRVRKRHLDIVVDE